MSFGAAFLLLVVIVLFESITIFRSYMGVLNSAREGAVYAAHHPDLCSGEKITCETASLDGDEAYFGLDWRAEVVTFVAPVHPG